MELSLDMKMLENLSEGVILLTKSGHITDFNKAATPWLKPCFNAADQLATLIQAAIRDKIQSPIVVTILGLDGRNAKSVKTYLCSAGKTGFALLITPLAPLATTAVPEPKTSNFVLVSTEVRHQITQLQEQLATLKGAQADMAAVAQSLEHMSRLLTAINQLSQLSEIESFTLGERISVDELISTVLGSMTHRRCNYSVNASPNDHPDQLGLVYGNAEWLKCGLRGLLDGLDEGAQAGSPIELKVRQSGGFVVLTAKSMGADGDRITGASKPLSMACAAMGVASDIRVPIARRIIELHNGQLKIVEIDSENPDVFLRGIASFTLILPTGSPGKKRNPECDNCLVGQQAWAYARDLAQLMPTSTVDSDLSSEEREFLMQVMGRN